MRHKKRWTRNHKFTESLQLVHLEKKIIEVIGYSREVGNDRVFAHEGFNFYGQPSIQWEGRKRAVLPAHMTHVRDRRATATNRSHKAVVKVVASRVRHVI